MLNDTYNCHLHLDFHTSEHIKNIGERFNAKEFADGLENAKVNSITVFAKCHHGWCYYPTECGKTHPHLSFDLLGEQIRVCKERGMRVLVYITGAWSVQDYLENPRWQVLDETGKPIFTRNGGVNGYYPQESGAKPDCTWPLLCLNGSYGEKLIRQAGEVCAKYDFDGLFFDIMGLEIPCYCEECKKGMEERGYDINNTQDVFKYLREKRLELFWKLRKVVKDYKPNGDIFFNSGGAEISQSYFQEPESYFELESLPSLNPFGMDSLINRGKYFAKKEKKTYGMTGKFHTSWGEFGGYKHPDALRNECATLLSYPVACSIGEQLHPAGMLDAESFKAIGKAYSYVESMEKYVKNAKGASRLGVILNDDYDPLGWLLTESGFDYELVFEEEDFSKNYDCILLSERGMSAIIEEKLCSFLENGGKLVAFGNVCFGEKLKKILSLGECEKSEYDVDYVLLEKEYQDELLTTPFLTYRSGYILERGEGYESVAKIVEPYFSRTEERYCSHKNTPYKLQPSENSAAFYNEKFLYFAHELPSIYREYGTYYLRKFFERIFKAFFVAKVSLRGLPCGGRHRILKGEEGYLLFLSYRAQFKRGIYTVEETAPCLRDVEVTVRVKETIDKIRTLPQKESIPFIVEGGTVKFKVDFQAAQYVQLCFEK